MRADPLIGSELAGYRVDELVGRGGMGVVYRAEHLLLGRTDAIKLLSPELAEDSSFRERFLRESRLAASIDHPNIVPIYHAGESDGLLFIAMRFVDGTDLKTLLREQRKLDAEQTATIVDQVASALDAAHAFNLVHRDVKPGNILLASGDRVYLTDFGIAKHTATYGGLTKTGSFVGTLDYAAPEQIEGKHLDGRSDVYSLGCVAFQCLCGGTPYEKDSEVQLIYAHLLEPPPAVRERNPELPSDVDAVIARALAKSKEDRFTTAGEFATALQAALATRAPSTTRVERPRRADAAAPPQSEAPPAPAPRAEAPPAPVADAAPPPAPARAAAPAAPPREPVAPPAPAPVPPAPSRARRLPVKLLAAAALAAAALVVAAVALMGGGGSGFPNAEEERLLSLIPAPVRDSCARTREMPEAVAAVACRAQRQGVSYFRFADNAPMIREYARRANVYLSGGVRRDAGACGELPRIGERPYTAGGRRVGRVFCAPSGSSAFIGWTDERANVFTLASRADEDAAALYRWWQRAAGPLRSPRAGSAERRISVVALGALLYRETFSSGAGDWARPNTRLADYSSSGGRYRITVKQPGAVIPVTTANASPPLLFGSVRLEAVAVRVGGQRSYGFGLVCRSSRGALYTLQIRSDGLALIRRRRAGRPPVELAKPRSLGRRALRAGQNRIAATCAGGSGRVRLTLSLNGRQVLAAVDRSPIASSGAVGLLASSLAKGGVSVAFDDFRVRKS